MHVLYLQHRSCTLLFVNSNARKNYYTPHDTQKMLDNLRTKLDTPRKQAIPTPGWIQRTLSSLYICACKIHSCLANLSSKLFSTIRRTPDTIATQSAHSTKHASVSTCKVATHAAPTTVPAQARRRDASTTKHPSPHNQHTPSRTLKRNTSFLVDLMQRIKQAPPALATPLGTDCANCAFQKIIAIQLY